MTKDEALLYLPIESIDELEDVYDDRLFEWRQFFISKVPLTKLFAGKIEQLRKMHQAYEVLAEEKIDADFAPYDLLSYDVDNVFDLVIRFQNNVNNLRQAVIRCESFLELIDVAKQQLENMTNYASHWPLELENINNEVKVSVPQDEVALLVELEQLYKGGRASMEEIEKLDMDSTVYREAIRLSLWRKLEVNV